MPIASPEVYAAMLDRAKAGKFAYPAINVTSSSSVNAAIQGFADAESDGIVQISWGGAEFASGQRVKDMVTGAVALAEFAHVVAAKYGVNIALHTDHCPPNKLDGYMRPLIEISKERVAHSQDPLFGSHMWDGSAVSLEENLKIYTTPEDALRTVELLGLGENGRYMLAATFGNVHGVYKPGGVKLRPSVLKEIQEEVGAKYGKPEPFDLVFHGGSGSLLSEIRETLDYGVIKMNVDTDTQYAYTRPVADHMLKNYDGVLKIDGEVGNKKMYDPRGWSKLAENGMSARVLEACTDLRSIGTHVK
jgi:fructose-bisphosphate aldolase class II